jgi:hypothetical protein
MRGKMEIKLKLRNIIFLSLVFGCATADTPLRLADRTLLIDPLGPSLIYPYNGKKCKYPNRRFFKRCKNHRYVIKYDLTEKKTRDLLIASKFQCRSGLRFNYD